MSALHASRVTVAASRSICFSHSPRLVTLLPVPELPEVEVLVRHLAPLLEDRTIRAVRVRRAKVLAPASTREFTQALLGAKFCGLARRGKYLLFRLRQAKRAEPLTLVGHLGMTGRMYLLPAKARLPRHAAVVLNLGRENFVFEDTRYFGRLTLDLRRAGEDWDRSRWDRSSRWSASPTRWAVRRQPIKVKLLDQSLLAGVGNIYASEALFRAGIAPTLPARRLRQAQVGTALARHSRGAAARRLRAAAPSR